MKVLKIIIIIIISLLTITACTNQTNTGASTVPIEINEEAVERGKILFQQQACGSCHTIAGFSEGIVGPDLTNLYAEKGETYLWEAIADPNAVTSEDYPSNVMPPYGNFLSPEEISDLVTFLSSVKK